jgi:hypothetical protein
VGARPVRHPDQQHLARRAGPVRSDELAVTGAAAERRPKSDR